LNRYPCEHFVYDPKAALETVNRDIEDATFDHDGITIHNGRCELVIHETISREYPWFPRVCPECFDAKK